MTGPPSAAHPRLADAAEREALRGRWSASTALRIDEVLAPGLAAELADWLPTLPLEPRYLAEQVALTWACEIQVPDEIDPQHPEALYRLVDFLDRDLPALARTITGRALAPPVARVVHVSSLRRGAYVDAGTTLAPPGGIDVVLGLTGPRWPADCGGHTERLDDDGAVSQRLAPGFDTLDLYPAGRYRVPLLTRPVRTLAVRTLLVPEETR